VEGEQLTTSIKHGSVLDANGRSFWALSQIKNLLKKIDAGEITSDDVVYFDDFWHPGISALPYSFHLMGIHPRMYAMLHAQTVDPYDFTYPMRSWMRPFEVGIGKVLDGIFVTSTCLRDALLYAGIGTPETVHLAGLPYNSKEVRTHFPDILPNKDRTVIYSSRWDTEKRPDLFLKIVDAVLSARSDIQFVVTTSAKKLRSNDPELLLLLAEYCRKYPFNLKVLEGQTKEQYYKNLLQSRIQINTGDQDFVSWTLLEATTCGCMPLYPYFLSFPEALEYNHHFMYQKGDIQDAAQKIRKMIDTVPSVDDFTWVYKKYDQSWQRMLSIMKGEEYEPLYRNPHTI